MRINDKKMSKSLGNFFTVREILQRYRPEEIRYFILTSQYRSPLNYDDEHLKNARGALTRFYTALRGLPAAEAQGGGDFVARFHDAMEDDFNTPEALAAMFDLAREINRLRAENEGAAAALAAQLRQLGEVLGILQEDADAYLRGGEADAATQRLSDGDIEKLVHQRTEARKARDFAAADRIRDDLKALGVVLEDGAGTTTWRRE